MKNYSRRVILKTLRPWRKIDKQPEASQKLETKDIIRFGFLIGLGIILFYALGFLLVLLGSAILWIYSFLTGS